MIFYCTVLNYTLSDLICLLIVTKLTVNSCPCPKAISYIIHFLFKMYINFGIPFYSQLN